MWFVVCRATCESWGGIYKGKGKAARKERRAPISKWVIRPEEKRSIGR